MRSRALVMAVLGLLGCAVELERVETCVAARPSGDSRVLRLLTSRETRCSTAVVGRSTVYTAAHCVRATDRLVLVLDSGVRAGATIAVRDRDRDFAVLHADRDLLTGGDEPFEIATIAPEPGDVLELTGWGCGYRRETKVLAVVREARAAGCSCRGDSGGAVVNEAGELVGLQSGWTSIGTLRFTQVTAQP